MSRIVLESAQKNLQRHLRLGKSIRSPGGTNQVKSLILAAQANPAIARLCRSYRFNVRDLSAACVEIIAEKPDGIVSGTKKETLPTSVFFNPVQLEKFLQELHIATNGKPPIQRHLAIVACAKKQAARMESPAAGRRKHGNPPGHRRPAVDIKIPLALICAAIILIGIMIVIELG